MYIVLFFGLLATLILFLSPLFLVLKFAMSAMDRARQSGLNPYFPVTWATTYALLTSFFIITVYFSFMRVLRVNPEPMVCLFFSGDMRKCEERYGKLPSYLMKRRES